MLSDEELKDMIDIVRPSSDRDEDCRKFLQQVIEFIRVRADHFAAKKHEFRLSAPDLRDSLKQLSTTLSKAAKQARGLGPDNVLLRLSLAEELKIENKSSSSVLADHLEICRQIVVDAAERVIVSKPAPGRDPLAALAATYACSILERFGDRPIASTEGGALSRLTAKIYVTLTGEEKDLARYVKREAKFYKKQAEKSRK